MNNITYNPNVMDNTSYDPNEEWNDVPEDELDDDILFDDNEDIWGDRDGGFEDDFFD